MTSRLWLALFGAFLIGACEPTDPTITVENAWIRPDPQMENAVGYLVIRNDSAESDTLVGVQVGFSRSAAIHQSVIDNGVHRMVHIEELEIPPGGEVAFRPLGYHIMMMGLRRDLEIGEVLTFKLTFERTGEVDVRAEVRRE